jgi:hypothetical protein
LVRVPRRAAAQAAGARGGRRQRGARLPPVASADAVVDHRVEDVRLGARPRARPRRAPIDALPPRPRTVAGTSRWVARCPRC